MKLTTKLTVLFLLLSILPLAVVGYLAYDNGRRAIEQNTINRLTSITTLKADELNRWVENNQRQLRSLAREPLVRESAAVLAAGDPADPAYQAAHGSIHADHLDPAIEEEGGFLELFVLRPGDGLILVSTDETQEGKYRENEPYFVEGKTHTYVQNVYYSLTRGEPTMTIGTPITDQDGELIAVLAGHLDLAEMSEIMLQVSELSPTEESYLINTFNFFVTESRFEPGSALRKTAYTEGVEACLEGNDGVGFYEDYRGVPVIGAYHWMPERELCILTEVDQAEAFGPVVALRNTIIGIGAAVALIVTLLGLFFARTITGPMSQLVKGTEEIGRGNLDYRIAVASRDEIGQLAGAFNAMAAERKRAEEALAQQAEELARSNAELERRVNDLKALNTMATIVNQSLDVDEILNRAMDEALRLVGVEAAGMLLLDEEAGELALVAHRGISDEFVRAASRLKLGEGLAGRAVQAGEPVVISRLAEYPGVLKAFVEKERIQSAASVPLRGRAGMVGAMSLGTADPHYFDAAGLELLVALGRQIAIGVEKARLWEQVQTQLEELERSNAELEQFAYVASHDLQEPLRMVASYTQLLARRYKGQLDADADEFIAYAVDGAERMQKMVNDLLAYSRVGTRGKEFAPVDCEAVLERVLVDLQMMVEDTQATVTHDPLPTVMADDVQLEQLFRNLISNAIKFRSQKPPRVHISAQLRRDGKESTSKSEIRNAGLSPSKDPKPEWLFSVRDNGIGIEPQYADRIFVIFQRLHNREKYSGTGIGLAIAKRIVERHGGRIWVESQPGEGTTFYFTIPVTSEQ